MANRCPSNWVYSSVCGLAHSVVLLICQRRRTKAVKGRCDRAQWRSKVQGVQKSPPFRSGRFVKVEQWEGWRFKRKLVSGSKHRERLRRSGGVTPGKFFENVYAKSCNLVHVIRKMVRNAVHNAFLNTSTMGRRFRAFPLEMAPR